MLITYALVAVGVVNLLIALYVLYKVRRVHLMTFRLVDEIRRMSGKGLIDLHQQLQALHCLYRELDLGQGLPPTRGWSASPDFLLLVARHARRTHPRTIIECGSGTSTVVLARCAQLNGTGHVYSLEHDAEFGAATRANLERLGLSDWATVIDAPLCGHELAGQSWTWYATESLPEAKIDLLVIDGPPLPLGPLIRYPAGPLLFPRLAEHGIVFLDDAAREDEREIVARWSREFPNLKTQMHETEKGCATFTPR